MNEEGEVEQKLVTRAGKPKEKPTGGAAVGRQRGWDRQKTRDLRRGESRWSLEQEKKQLDMSQTHGSKTHPYATLKPQENSTLTSLYSNVALQK